MANVTETEAYIKQLITKRGSVKGLLTRFCNFVDKNLTDSNQIKTMQLETRLNDALSLLEKFNTIQEELELLDIGEISPENTEREEFENSFYEYTQLAKNLIFTFRQNNPSIVLPISEGTSNQNINVGSSCNNLNINYPMINVPKFYGDYEKWGQFRDMYTSLVHNIPNLSRVRKFQLLVDALRGDAAKIIECIEITDDNYQTAWNMLIERYQNKTVIIQKHISSLVELPNVTGKEIYLALRSFTDSLRKHLRSLENLGEPVNQWDTLLFYLMTKKLDYATQKDWESLFISKTLKKEKTTFKEFIDFLDKRCLILETICRDKNDKSKLSNDTKSHPKNNSFYKKSFEKSFSGHVYKENQYNNCPYCKENHFIYACNKFKSLSVPNRTREINNLKLCINCLRRNHESSQCVAQKCKKCNQHHNTLLHPEQNTPNYQNNHNLPQSSGNNINANTSQSPNSSQNMPISNHTISEKTQNTISNTCNAPQSQVLLSTAVVLIKDSANNWQQCRALLDNGSIPNFMTTKLQRILSLIPRKTNISVKGVGNSGIDIDKAVSTQIKSRFNNYSAHLSFFVTEKITENLPLTSFSSNLIKIPPEVALADKKFNESREIDILIGASIFSDLLGSDQIRLGSGLPILQQTQLGYIISGSVSLKHKNSTLNHKNISNRVSLGNEINHTKSESQYSTICNLSINKSLEKSIEKFWSIEEISTTQIKSIEEQECEELFSKTVTRDQTGHFIVNLPIRENVGQLGNSLDNAIKRLHSIERRFLKDESFKNKYTEFMCEYEQLGHMTQINTDSFNTLSPNIFYLPHHGVINEASETTKLRVVFDGSCKSSTGISVNDILKVGPTIQPDLLTILLRFRQHNVVITGDIAKMYRQVNIVEHQRDLQRIVWRSSPDENIKHYRLNTVTYGTSAAAFLAVRSLHQVAIEIEHKHPKISSVIRNDFYVDDLLTGVNTIQEAKDLKLKLSSLLSKYGFELRKWSSNRPEILKDNEQTNDFRYFVTEDEVKKTLGLFWQSNRDVLAYKINKNQINEKITKRLVLSLISKLFDPLGLLSPITVVAKLLMQSLWELKLGWDDSLPENLANSWLKFNNNLQQLSSLQIPRLVIIPNAINVEIHGFSDASQRAYSACIYLKSVNIDGDVSVKLLTSKTRVAPLKIITLPRLELQGALILSQLYQKVTTSLNINISRTFLWTDSTIVLAWINSQPNTLKIFVGNRVSEIQNLTCNTQWRHVPTDTNPADIASRGTEPSNLLTNSFWWNGPEWLQRNEEFWPNQIQPPETDLEKRKSQTALKATPKKTFELFFKFSSLYKLQRVTAIWIRLINILKNPHQKIKEKLSVEELNNSLLTLIKIAQHESFSEDIKCLNRSKCVPKNSKIKNLDPFIDEIGFLRVGGRLSKSHLDYNTKHQYILDQHHILTRLIILNEHHRHLHAGLQAILATTRERFWILNGRTTIRNILRKCTTCFRVNPKNIIRKMADLPTDRITPNRPFYIVGTDFAGPYNIKDGKLRNRQIIKAYLCVFVCFTTKAVHLEVVSDLSTASFLNAFKRFVARRGLCKRVYSDNGTNFVGASRELKNLYETINKIVIDHKVTSWFLKNNIEWKFNPPYSPHRGGLWEAAVRQAKYHFNRIVGKLTLTFEDLSTVFTQIESIMNSRPLHPLSSDPNDFSILTPGHFLIGQSLTTLPQPDFTELPENRLKQYQVLQQAVQLFWKHWSKDYLHQLQQRTRWQDSSQESIGKNSMVLLIDNNLPPLYWKLGRVVELHKGSDGLIRTATIRTQSGVTSRAVQKLCVLPTLDN